jgi:hypothetical protein
VYTLLERAFHQKKSLRINASMGFSLGFMDSFIAAKKAQVVQLSPLMAKRVQVVVDTFANGLRRAC